MVIGGYLDKQGSSTASFWRRRYVGCTKVELQYFSDKKYAHNRHAMKGCIQISDMTNIYKSGHSDLIFNIDTRGIEVERVSTEGRQYRFAAQTSAECQEWIDILTTLVQGEDTRYLCVNDGFAFMLLYTNSRTKPQQPPLTVGLK